MGIKTTCLFPSAFLCLSCKPSVPEKSSPPRRGGRDAANLLISWAGCAGERAGPQAARAAWAGGCSPSLCPRLSSSPSSSPSPSSSFSPSPSPSHTNPHPLPHPLPLRTDILLQQPDRGCNFLANPDF